MEREVIPNELHGSGEEESRGGKSQIAAEAR